MMRVNLVSALLGWIAVAGGATAQDLAQNDGATFVSRSGVEISVLLDQSNLGSGDVELAEIFFPAGSDSGNHPHSVVEIFYVRSGELEHIVDGHSMLLKPGMVGFVRPPDLVRHRAAGDTRVLVIWVPGGEAAGIVSRLTRHESAPVDAERAQ